MPVNRNALIRFKTIDNCLRNRVRRWTIDDLIEACSEALYEFEGIDKGVSRRTVQMDIQVMRSEKLGYQAPIIVIEKKFYTYEDHEYSITNIPHTQQDLGKLTEVVEILRQFKGFSHFQELSGMVQKLEDKVHVSKTKQRPIIDLEKNDSLKGIHFIDPIYRAIQQKRCLLLEYQSFKARNPQSFEFHPALLKEYRNRWFVLGKRTARKEYLLLALDRIESLSISDTPLLSEDDQVVSDYFKNVVGVSVNINEPPQTVIVQVQHQSAPYVMTKPIHHSQKILDKTPWGIRIQLEVQLNFELERELLGFGETLRVESPLNLRRRIYSRLMHSKDLYDCAIDETSLKSLNAIVTNQGNHVLGNVYSTREVNKMKMAVYKYVGDLPHGEHSAPIRNVLGKIPDLKPMLFNENLNMILQKLNPNLVLRKAILFSKSYEHNWQVGWHQDLIIQTKQKADIEGYSQWTSKEENYGVRPPLTILQAGFTLRIHLDDTSEKNGALKVLSGSHKDILSPEQIETITTHAQPRICEMNSGAVHIMKPLLLHASSKSLSKNKRRVLHLEFNSEELAPGLEWA